MTATYDCGISTNWEAWRAVHDGIRDGLSFKEISGRTGLSYQMVGIYSRQEHPASICRRINRNHEGAHRCCECGMATAHETDGGRCDKCERKRRIAEANMPGRVEVLRSWALRHGRVPTVGEARDILGIGRSRAGDIVVEAFGPDHRSGFHRVLSYRGWPEGAPDVAIPGAAEKLSIDARIRYWKSQRRKLANTPHGFGTRPAGARR